MLWNIIIICKGTSENRFEQLMHAYGCTEMLCLQLTHLTLHHTVIQAHGAKFLFYCFDVCSICSTTHIHYVWCRKQRQCWSKKSEHRYWIAVLFIQSHLIDGRDQVSTTILCSYFIRPRQVCFWDVSLQWPVSNQAYFDQNVLYKTWLIHLKLCISPEFVPPYINTLYK